MDLQLIRHRLARRTSTPLRLDDEPARAAVAAVLREGASGPEVLLIRRSHREGDPWSGHMAFPGGRQDASDADLLATALRETREEVGLDLARHAEVVGRLDDITAMARGKRAGLVVSPFVFALASAPVLSLSDEVDAIHWAPIEPMRRGETSTTFAYSGPEFALDLPGFRVGNEIVWGLTHRMLSDLFQLLAEELT
jgi:8-oxo-dGTP pyrophosphatase MutT (NUDIX family)